MTNLKRLNLWDTQVTDAGLVHLAGMTNLKELNLIELHPGHRRGAGAPCGADQSEGAQPLRHPGHRCGRCRTKEVAAELRDRPLTA